MTTQPEALRLADRLSLTDYYEFDAALHCPPAAAELRRPHQFTEDQIGRATAAEAALQMTKTTHALKIAAVEAQRDALLSALKGMLLHMGMDEDEWNKPTFDQARAAIKAVEENT